MQPNQPQQVQASDGTPLDPSVVALAKATRDVESQGNYNAKGKSGEHGAYQWMPGNFENDAKKYGLDPLDFSPVNQDKVAYQSMLADKKSGLTPEQIASKWNSGDPNAYTKPHTGTNAQGVSYDTPGYVKKVVDNYTNYKDQYLQNNTTQPQTPTSPTPASGDNQDWMTKTANVLGSFFGGNKIGELIGGLYDKTVGVPGIDEHGNSVDESKYVELPTAGQVAGDVGKSALTIAAPYIGGTGGLLTRLAGSTALGAGLGATNALANKQDVGSQALTGAGLGLAGGVVGEVASKLIGVLPKWLVASGLKGADESSLDSAMNGKFFTINGGLKETQGAMDDANTQIASLLKDAENIKGLGFTTDIKGAEDSAKIVDNALNGYTNRNGQAIEGFTNSRYTPETLLNTARSLTPQNGALWDKFEAGQASISEINQLRSDLDQTVKSVYTKLNLPPAKKAIGAALASAMRDYVQSAVPETQPLFAELSKNYGLKDILLKAAKTANAPTKIGFRDLLALFAGHAAGIPGSIGLEALNRISQSPGTEVAAGKLLQGAGGLITGAEAGLKAPLMSGLINSANQ